MSVEQRALEMAAQMAKEQANRLKEQTETEHEEDRRHSERAEKIYLNTVRNSMLEVDAKTAQMRTLLYNLDETHKLARTSVSTARQERQSLLAARQKIEILLNRSDLKAVFERGGIHSVEDLLASPVFGNEDDARHLRDLSASRPEKKQTARTHMNARLDVKDTARKAVEKEGHKAGTYPEIKEALEKVIGNLEAEHRRLFIKTPEGMEARRNELLKLVKERLVSRFGRDSILSPEHVHSYEVTSRNDFETAEQYGPDEVKNALKNAAAEIVDRTLAQKKEQSGTNELADAVATIRALPKRWKGVDENFKQLLGKRNEVVSKLEQLIETDETLAEKLKGFGRRDSRNPREIAQHFVERVSEFSSQSLNWDGQKTLEINLDERIVGQQRKIRNDWEQHDMFPRQVNPHANHEFSSNWLNPEKITLILKELEAFYGKLEAAMTSPQEFLDAAIHRASRFNIQSRYALGLGDEAEYYLGFKAKIYDALKQKGVGGVEKQLEAEDRKTRAEAEKMRSLISAKIDMEWAEKESSVFHGQHQKDLEQAEYIKTLEGKAWISPRLDIAAAQAKMYADEPVSAGKNSYNFDSAKLTDLSRMDGEIVTLDDEIKALEDQISVVNNKLKTGYGMFGDPLGFVRKADEKSKKDLQTQKNAKSTQRHTIHAEHRQKSEKHQTLKDFNSWVDNAREQGVKIVFPAGSRPFNELVEIAREQISLKLSSEQEALYKQSLELNRRKSKAQETYKELRKSA